MVVGMNRPAVPTARPFLRRSAALSAGIAIAVLLAGCAAPSVEPTPSATAPAVPPTPTPTAPVDVPNPGGTPPEQVFNGDCLTVFSPEEVEIAATWPAMNPVGFVNSVPDMALVHQVGGLGCVWAPLDGVEGFLQATVVPQEVLSARLAGDGTTCFLQFEKTYICSVDVEANGYHLSANLTTANDSSYEKANAASAVLAEIFATHANALAAAVTIEQPDGAWPLDFSCADLADSAKVGKALDNSDLKISDGGGDVQVTAAETDLWNGRPFLRCYWRDGAPDADQIGEVTVAVLGGGGWSQLEVAQLPGAEEVNIDGVELAIVVHDPEGTGAEEVGDLHIFDGVNWFVLSATGVAPESLYNAVPVLIDGLDSL